MHAHVDRRTVYCASGMHAYGHTYVFACTHARKRHENVENKERTCVCMTSCIHARVNANGIEHLRKRAFARYVASTHTHERTRMHTFTQTHYAITQTRVHAFPRVRFTHTCRHACMYVERAHQACTQHAFVNTHV